MVNKRQLTYLVSISRTELTALLLKYYEVYGGMNDD